MPSSSHVLLIEPVLDGADSGTLSSILREASIETRIVPRPSILDTTVIENLAAQALEHHPSLIILELDHSSASDDEQFRSFLYSLQLDIPIIVAVQNPTATSISSMLELGVTDFVTPPFTRANVLPRVWHLLKHNEPNSGGNTLLKENVALTRNGLIGESPSFLEEIRKLRLLARCDVTVMIWGETGTGKELAARAIHYLSSRTERPFVPVDCGAIPPGLAESEVFGHERGAFTGAVAKHHGLVAAAEHGTLFLDEVDALSLSVQAKLLRLLQEREYRSLGSSDTKKADVRVISATNRDLKQLVRGGGFREDLYYRLNVAQLRLPALRQRQEDIALLARHFVAKWSTRFRLPLRQFSPGALQKLLIYHWAGNVRELENVIEAAVALCDGSMIYAKDLVLATEPSQSGGSFREAKARIVSEFEREYVSRLLGACRGNVSEAARVAGKNRRAFWELIRRHNVDVQELRDSFGGMTNHQPTIRAAG